MDPDQKPTRNIVNKDPFKFKLNALSTFFGRVARNLGFDFCRRHINFRYPEYAQADCEIACDFAAQVGKPCALAETGIDDGITSVTNADWYMSDLLDNLLDYSSPTSSCQNLSYVLTWSNEQPGR